MFGKARSIFQRIIFQSVSQVLIFRFWSCLGSGQVRLEDQISEKYTYCFGRNQAKCRRGRHRFDPLPHPNQELASFDFRNSKKKSIEKNYFVVNHKKRKWWMFISSWPALFLTHISSDIKQNRTLCGQITVQLSVELEWALPHSCSPEAPTELYWWPVRSFPKNHWTFCFILRPRKVHCSYSGPLVALI